MEAEAKNSRFRFAHMPPRRHKENLFPLMKNVYTQSYGTNRIGKNMAKVIYG